MSFFCLESCSDIWLYLCLQFRIISLQVRISFMVTCVQNCFRSVKVTWIDLFSFISKRHLRNHFSIKSRPRWRVEEAIVGSEWDANKAVSSANIVVVISVKVGKAVVKMVNSRGPRTLPWDMPTSIRNVAVLVSKYLIMNSLLVRYDFKME